jgi:cytochrome oxidase Cu insertion factor (SCO1/SenC/PrrC family)
MAYKVRDEQDARDLWAYFVTVTPELTDPEALALYEEATAAATN